MTWNNHPLIITFFYPCLLCFHSSTFHNHVCLFSWGGRGCALFLCLCLILFSLLNSELSPEDGLKALPSCVRSSVVGITLVAAAAPASTASSPPATPCHYHGLCPWRPWAACCRPGRRTSSLWRTCSSSRCPGRSPTKVRQNTDILIYLFVYFHWRNSLV